jgi:putative transcriptional regulator
MDSLKGQLLISAGGLYDPNFRHTVVLIGEHNAEGALGVVLNRPMELAVADVVDVLAPLVPPGEPIFQGGPVQLESVVILGDFLDPSASDLLVLDTVGFLTGEVPADVADVLRRARVYAGYSGWGAGQLEREMSEGSWLVEPALPEDVFTDEPELLWSRVVRRKGPDFGALSRMPYDPRMN